MPAIISAEKYKKKHNTKIRVNEYVGIEEGERGWD